MLPLASIPEAEAGAVPAPCGPAACRGVRTTLCYDRPPLHFRPTALHDAHELLVRLRPALEAPLHPHDCVAKLYQAPEDGLEVGARAALNPYLAYVHQHWVHADDARQTSTTRCICMPRSRVLHLSAAVPEPALCWHFLLHECLSAGPAAH